MPEDRAFRRHFVTERPDDTRVIGSRLGGAAEAGDVFLLEGDFGSGKTVLVRGMAEGLGIPTEITSPSFVIINQHQGRLTLHHVDLYRIEQLDPETAETVADVIEAGGVTCIEWPQLLPADLRRGATLIRFARGEGDERLIVLETDHDRLLNAADQKPDGLVGG